MAREQRKLVAEINRKEIDIQTVAKNVREKEFYQLAISGSSPFLRSDSNPVFTWEPLPPPPPLSFSKIKDNYDFKKIFLLEYVR